ncbi:MAG: PEP-utilizing enzyme [Mycobacterium leprae]
MNILRKAMAEEAERLKPLLDLAYNAIERYQRDRNDENEARLREAMAPAVAQLMLFRPYMPTYKQDDFNALERHWRELTPHDLIMLFDHCVNIMHLRMDRNLMRKEPWSAALLAILDERQAIPAERPAQGEFLCSGIPASPGVAVGPARVVADEAGLATLQPGEILVCRMSTPDWAQYLDRVRAIVTDQGGAVCHAAVVARELGLPCVTGCGDATTVIRTGDRIEVNGELGIVTAP